MRRPFISNSSYYKLTVPELSGGVNLRDNISLVHDNQLTECENVWYKDGMLRTRPGTRVTDFNAVDESNTIASTYGDVLVYASEKNTRIEDGHLYFLVVVRSDINILVKYISATNTERPVIDVATIIDMPSNTVNVFQNGRDIYLFGSLELTVSLANGLPIYKIYKEILVDEVTGEKDEGEWKAERVQTSGELAPYIPTVIINGVPSKNFQDSIDTMISRGATMLEGFNLLGNRYKMMFSNALEYESNLSGEVGSDAMKFTLLEDTWKFVGKKVIATIVDEGGVETVHEVEITTSTGNSDEATVNTGDNRRMRVFGKCVMFLDSKGSIIFTPRNKFIRNCITIEAPCSNPEENLKKVLNMTFNDWYGGGSEGLYGGMHLFMGGNTEKGEESLVIWSDVKKPLYFSENCYAYVGDKSQKVTAFGKQGEALIIAKEREMYATQYVNNTDALTEEAVQRQALIDITTDAIFPMTQVHGFIGCDCPKTMQLCRNRLVWANSNGKVYSLVSANQYNERSIYEVSGMVERRLKEFSRKELQGAMSADWQGFYVLMVGSNLFLMDYNSYGFSSVYSYSKTEDAQSRIPWWIWKLDFPNDVAVLNLVSIEDKLFFSHTLNIKLRKSNYIEMLYFDAEAKNDEFVYIEDIAEGTVKWVRTKEQSNIHTMMHTKCFDFGTPTVLKNIPKIEMVFGTNGGAPITVTTITNRGDDSDIYIEAPEADKYSIRHLENKLIRPAIQRADRLSLKLECSGVMAVDSMAILYKQLGGLK